MSGHLSLKWNNHSSAFLRSISTIQDKERYCDATIACQGKYFPVHRIVLSTCSDYFEEMFERIQCQHPYIVFKDIEPQEMEMLLNYMYQGEVNVVQEMLPMLIKAAEALRIKGLAVPDDSPGKKRSSSSSDSPQQKRRTEDVKRRRRNSSGSNSQVDASSSEAGPNPSPLERLATGGSHSPGLDQTEHKIKQEILDPNEYNSRGADDPLSASGQAATSEEEGVFVNYPATLDNSFVKSEGNESNDQQSYETETTWSEFGSGSTAPTLPHIEMNSQDNISEACAGWKIQSEQPFSSQADLSMCSKSRIQEEDSKFSCPFCAYKSHFKQNAQRHIILKHTETRPFSCSFCLMRFTLKQHLVSHVRIHTGEKPYRCHRCSTRFTNYASLHRHLRRKTICRP